MGGAGYTPVDWAELNASPVIFGRRTAGI